MSQNESRASEEASDEPKSASVLDILYCDNRRIGAFLSQFDELGIPTQITVSESVQKARGRSFKFAVGGSIPGVGDANFDIERGPAIIGGSNGETRNYDPLWVNALALADYLVTNDLVVRDVESARIGQFALVIGTLAIMDLTLFKGVWSLPALLESVKANQATDNSQEAIRQSASSRQQRRADQRNRRAVGVAPNNAAAPPNIVEGAMALVGMLPHAIQARLTVGPNSGATVWASLNADCMVVSASDILLKHGMAVAGEWRMLGILDALPDESPGGDLTTSGMESIARSATLGDGPFGQMLLGLIPTLRPMLGRPFSAHGMTPLMIYRLISP